MIRGINRQVIEITETGNIYYERALLVVRPEYRSAQKAILEKEARKMLKQMRSPSVIKKQQLFLYWFLRLAPAMVVGGGVATLFLKFL